MHFAPLVLFTYKRLDTLQQTFAALKNNYLATETELHIFSDAAKTREDELLVKEVRDFIKTIDGFKKVDIYNAEINKGLAKSIIDGVTTIIYRYERVIVLEDDLITSPNFLTFMNAALDFYEKNKKIFSLAGYTPPIQQIQDDVYFTRRASSWGWATWKDRWEKVDWKMTQYSHSLKNPFFKKSFNNMGSDLYKMLKEQSEGKINSWAIRWCYHQFLIQQYTVFPAVSKVQNIGTHGNATNTKNTFRRFETILDPGKKELFNFLVQPHIDEYYLKQFLKPYTIS